MISYIYIYIENIAFSFFRQIDELKILSYSIFGIFIIIERDEDIRIERDR